ncbi:ubiquitin carboxyl-terminal hydrolase 2-like isoform X2 [Trichoplusia ni]|uniref:Ubiquitin carboxyl-terminal hydrolase n=1 Tax=Trichoplusia ni TaxID=7111 RepID=A0A7E5W2G2_TRINI|nr:ubiquitin carboxyl-terminal hydrolase 2-like isoform X2 [Trichoplusia ni]
MPVVSPSRYSNTSSTLTGSYRSTLTSSTVDKPYYRSTSGNYDTLRSYERSEYRSRYSDLDGNRERKTIVERRTSRAPSIADSDSGISSRYRSDRSESRSRDISTTRSESSKTSSDPLPRARRPVLTSADLAMSHAEWYNKYSPANYIPMTQRIQQQQNQNYGEISRSKSISNDIGRPPAADPSRLARKARNSAAAISEISQPVSSGATPKKLIELNHVNEEKSEKRDKRGSLKYIDSEDERILLDNDIESPSGTGFENKTFEHENYLKKRTEKCEDGKDGLEDVKSMETSTESTISEPTDDLSPETPCARRKVLDNKENEENKGELAGGKSGPSGLRRSSERSDSLAESRSDKQPSHTCGLNGLRNIGNTCFMNSVLQCLSNTKPLLEYLQDDKYTDDINTSLSCMKGALIKAFGSLIKELWRSGERDAVVNTTSFKSQVQRFAPRFMGYSQQDAQEFLRYLLEGLHEDVNRVTVKPKPIITEIDDSLSDSAKAAEAWSRYLRMEDSRVGDIFVGQLKSTLRCTHCNHDSVTFDPFWDLSLPIPSRTGNLKLQQCLQHFTREEEMDGDEKPTCSKCGVRRKCLKWFTVQKFPQVLVLHLKRFSPTERFRGKLSVVVEFPLSGLDLSAFAATRAAHAVYNLYAVSNHSGTTYSGHYTAYCKHPYTGDWHEYNDSRVTPINSRNVVSSEAYVLFYELARHT